MPVTKATIEDIPRLVSLINSAYRGEASKQGWTTEADLLEGELRTDIPTLTSLMNEPDGLVLKYFTGESIFGSVYLRKQERGLYLGMLTVSPKKQAAGIGKELMKAAEAIAIDKNCPCIYMNVISIRDELVGWYERQGYFKTGETKPLPADTKFGKPTRPLEFAIMQKTMPKSSQK